MFAWFKNQAKQIIYIYMYVFSFFNEHIYMSTCSSKYVCMSINLRCLLSALTALFLTNFPHIQRRKYLGSSERKVQLSPAVEYSYVVHCCESENFV